MATNEYGLDVNYFKNALSIILRDIDRYTPREMTRALYRLGYVAQFECKCPICHQYDTVEAVSDPLAMLVNNCKTCGDFVIKS